MSMYNNYCTGLLGYVILFMETFEKVIPCEVMLSLSECVNLLFVHLFQVHNVQS